jgi:hypothetical protein
MQALSGIHVLSRFEPPRSRGALIALGALIAAVALAFGARPAAAATMPAAAPATKSCPSFRVLHDNRIGAAVLPAGNYMITLEDTSLTCKSGAELFARFLEDFDGVLPAPWKVAPESSGKAAFPRGSRPGFSVALTGKGGEEGGTNPDLGQLCSKPFMVTSDTVIRPLRFTKGKFLIYLPARSGITCNRAAVLFTRFLGAGGTLPQPWKLTTQTATFYKPANPTRSAFRIEPFTGAGGR